LQARVFGVSLSELWLRHFSAARPANGVFYFGKMADLSFTTIEEPARKALGISRDEYAICNYIETWSAYPNNRRPGFCDRTRGQMAEFIGITPRGVMKMLDKMERIGLIERYSETLFLHRITQHWFETVKLAKSIRKEEQSSPERGTKFSLKEEQSSPLKRNKVLPHKEYYKESNKEGKGNAQNAFSPPFSLHGSIEIPETNIPLEAEKKENDFAGAGPTPPAEFLVTTITPQAPYIRIAERVEIQETPGPKSPGEKIRELCEVNHKIRETFSMVRKIPASRFDEYLTAFDAEKTGLPIPQTWKNDNDLVMNFWAWSEIRYSKEQRAGQPQLHGRGRGAQLQNSGSDMSKYDQKQKF